MGSPGVGEGYNSFAGNDVNIESDGDTSGMASNVVAENDVELNAGNDINIVAAENTSFEKSSLTEVTYGVGIIATENELGVKSSVNFLRDVSEGDNLNNAASNIRSGGGLDDNRDGVAERFHKTMQEECYQENP